MVADFYAMLGVEPGSDRATIEAALKRCQPEWSSRTRHPSKGTLYQSYLDRIPEIRRRLLSDPTERAVYDTELTAAQQAERDRRLDALQRLVQIRAAKGGLTVTDRSLLRAEAERRGLNREDLDRLVGPFPPMPEFPSTLTADEQEAPRNLLDVATRRQIAIALEHLEQRDLYDLLGLRRDTPAAEIRAKAAAERQRWMQKAQVTAAKTAWLNAISLAQTHLGTPEARARYDDSLALEAEEQFGAVVTFALQGQGRLDPATREALLVEATAHGITPARGEALIRQGCRQAGVEPAGGPLPTLSQGERRLIRCRACHGLTDYAWSEIHGSGGCRHCHAPLTWSCPSCRHQGWVDERRCTGCGFAIENVEPMERHFAAAQHAFKLRRLNAAIGHLRRVQELAPHHVGARKGVEKVQTQLSEIQAIKARYRLERAAHRVVAARDLLEVWSRLVELGNPELEAARTECQERLEAAHQLVARARRRLGHDPAAARTLLDQALAQVVDLPEAREALELCPPEGPTDLHAEVLPDRIRLRWTAPELDGRGPLCYRILRKPREAPTHAGDGTVVAVVEGTAWDDRDLQLGDAFGYAVFSLRGKVASVLGVAAGPFVVAEDVRDVRVEARPGSIRLNWTPPTGAVGVRVVRQMGTPVDGPHEGVALTPASETVADVGLEDGRTYHYGLFALYRAPNGRLQPSRGVFVSAIPQLATRIVEDLRITPEADGRLRLQWPAPPVGQVRVLRTETPFGLATGERRTAGDLERLATLGRWLPEASAGHCVDDAGPTLRPVHYTPVTFAAGLATVGRSVAWWLPPDPVGLSVGRLGGDPAGRVRLQWRNEASGITHVVLARAGAPPTGIDDPEARRVPVPPPESDGTWAATLDLPDEPGGPPWQVRVLALAECEGQQRASPGIAAGATAAVPGVGEAVALTYRLKPPLIPGRPWSITLQRQPADGVIPPLILVANSARPPESAEDGTVVARFPSTRDGERLTFRPTGAPGLETLRLFADPAGEADDPVPSRIQIQHPEAGPTRV